MNMIQRFKAKTPPYNKKWGQFSTKCATVCAGVLSSGLITNTIAIVAMLVVVFAFGTHAVINGLKVEKTDKTNENG